MPNRAVSQEHINYLKTLKTKRTLTIIVQLAVLICFCCLWELAAVMKWIDPFIFSQPSRIARSAVTMISNGSLFLHIGVTLGETVAGFLLSTVIGTLVGIALWWNEFARRVLNPYLVILNSIPKTALAPIIIVWIGNNVNSVIATAIMTSVIVTIMTVLAGFLEVSSEKIKLVTAFGGTKAQVLRMVVLPSGIPSIINALKINIGLSFVGTMVGEFLVAQSGLGYLIVYGSQIFI